MIIMKKDLNRNAKSYNPLSPQYINHNNSTHPIIISYSKLVTWEYRRKQDTVYKGNCRLKIPRYSKKVRSLLY